MRQASEKLVQSQTMAVYFPVSIFAFLVLFSKHCKFTFISYYLQKNPTNI